MKKLWPAMLLIISINLNAATEFKRLVVFGDSLSDTGTYVEKYGPAGGGKFTTNPGKLWIEIIADKLHLPLQENRHEGFGLPLRIIGGFNYSQGGARVTLPNGNKKGYTSRSLTTQLKYFTSKQKLFRADDLIFIVGGANDVLEALNEVVSGKIQPQEALVKVAQAAVDIINMAAAIKKFGGLHVVVINLPAVENTPRALGLPAEAKTFIKQLGQTLNDVLAEGSSAEKKYSLIDFYSFDLDFATHYQSLGFKNVSEPACKLDSLAFRSSLLCNSKTLIEPLADQTYKFADSVHPTTAFSKISAEFIWQEIQKIFSANQ